MAKVLCLRRGGLGDTLMMEPVLRALREAGQAAELHFAGNEASGRLLAHYGVVDHARSSEELALWDLDVDSATGQRTRDYLAGFDRVVIDGEDLGARASPRVTVYSPVIDESGGVPASRQLLDRVGLPEPLRGAGARLRDHRAEVTGGAVLHPGSGGLSKCWPWERWCNLAAGLLRRGVTVDLVLGPAEVDRGWLSSRPPPAGVHVTAGADITVLAPRLEHARVFVGNDAGVTHLAAALQVPTVAIFGATDPSVWAPRGSHVHVVCDGERPPKMSTDAVGVVVASVLTHVVW